MKIYHIVAMAENRVIGRAGGMPWHIPEDFRFFKAKTMGHAMIMGRKTWESIGKPLPGRLSIVITRQPGFTVADGVVVCETIPQAIAVCEAERHRFGDECYIIGGGEIYRESMALADKIYLTQVHKHIDGDTFYPEIQLDEFEVTASDPRLDQKIPFTFLTYSRRDAKVSNTSLRHLARIVDKAR